MAHDDKRRPAAPASKPELKAGDGKPGRATKVSAERPFAEAAAALADLTGRATTGKVVLRR